MQIGYLCKVTEESNMRIAILFQNTSLYSFKRLIEAGEERGHEMYVIDYLSCYMNIVSQKPSVVYQG